MINFLLTIRTFFREKISPKTEAKMGLEAAKMGSELTNMGVKANVVLGRF